MAIFRYNEELEQKGSRKDPNKVKGFRKAALSVLGYDDSGERNQWGKITSIIPNPLGTVAKHQMARALSKGTDTRKVLDETQDENLAMGLSQLKTGIEGAKLLAGGGLGLGGGLGTASSGALGTGSASQIASKGLVSGGLGGGTDVANMATEDLLNYTDMLGGDNTTSTFSKLGGSAPSDMVKKMMADEETNAIKENLMKTAEETDVTDIIGGNTDETAQGLKTGGSKYLDVLDKSVPLLQAGLEQYATTKAYNKELEKEYKQYTAKTTKKNTANII